MTTPSQQYIYVQNPTSPTGTRYRGQMQPAGQQQTKPTRTSGPMSGNKTGQGQQSAGSGSRTGAPARRSITQQASQVNVPRGVPAVLGNRQIIFYAWIVAMILVGFDEWHNYHILPRPSRFWRTSEVYGVLILVSFADAMVPLANAFAVGYAVMLLWQYYNGSGQFGKSSSNG